MKLSEKILLLRKKQAWSQEDLAERLQVSRQSVSKWESGTSTPDLEKLLELADLFGLSLDQLLRSDSPLPDTAPLSPPLPEEPSFPVEETLSLSQEDCLYFFGQLRHYARQIALGVALCIFCPVPLLLLCGFAEYRPGFPLNENLSAGLGVAALLLLIALAAAIFIRSTLNMQGYAFLKEGPFILQPQAEQVLRQIAADFVPRFSRSITLGVVLCILSILPLLVAGAAGAPDLLLVWLVCLLLILVALAVLLFVTAGMEKEALDFLLHTGDFSPKRSAEAREEDRLGDIYWPIVTAIYLLWSFLSGDWHITWLLWPVAALLFASLAAASKKRS